MRSVVDNGSFHGLAEAFNLTEYVLSAGARRPDKPALVMAGHAGTEIWSHARLSAAVLGLAAHLADRDLAPGARVFLRLGNDPALPIAFLAAAAADLVPVVVSAALTAPEIAAAITETGPELIVADPALALPRSVTPPVLWRDDIFPAANRAPVSPVAGDPERPGYVVFTSGTSGHPRAVVHAHRAVWARRMMWDGWYGLGQSDRLLHAGAFNWTYTLGTGLLDPWAAGATALVPQAGTPPGALWALMAEHKVTLFAAAPAIYRRLLREARGPLHLPALRHGLSAGEKLSDTLRDRWTALTGTPLHEAFGMSECSTFISGCPGRPAPPGTLGWVQPGRRVAVVDDTGRPVKRGVAGHLAVCCHDPGLALGYLGHPQEMADRIRNAWFLTGDMATMADSGAIRYEGRSDDMMNAGGVRVSPPEVEAALLNHPAIRECAVTELQVGPETTVIAAFCVSDIPLDETELSDHMKGTLASYKVPRLYRRIPALPRNANGKVQRRALRRQHEVRDGEA